MSVTGRGGIEIDSDWGTVLRVSVSKGIRRTTSLRQVSTFPPGKYNFFSTPSSIDTCNTRADDKGYWYEIP